jgi:hypothetical protein
MTAIPSTASGSATVHVDAAGKLCVVIDDETGPREWEYVYEDGDGYVFLDTVTELPVTLPRECFSDARQHLQEGVRVRVVAGRS